MELKSHEKSDRFCNTSEYDRSAGSGSIVDTKMHVRRSPKRVKLGNLVDLTPQMGRFRRTFNEEMERERRN